MLFSYFEAKQFIHCGVPTRRKSLQTEQLLYLGGMTDTEH